jgi:acyl-CoA reductase-like NAD-dependent aldehyde dehydrogenase
MSKYFKYTDDVLEAFDDLKKDFERPWDDLEQLSEEERQRVLWETYDAMELVRKKTELIVILSQHRIGQEILEALKKDHPPTLTYLVGSARRGQRLKRLGAYTQADVREAVKRIHAGDRVATVELVLRTLKEMDEEKLYEKLMNETD